jgi:putative transposase
LEIGRFQPSSKICSCGEINNELSLKDRIWTCGKCNTTHDRDILAANNIVKFAFLSKNYLGKDSPDSERKKSVEKPVRASRKQKVGLISN